LKRFKTEKAFDPKYKNTSASERKFNEFTVDKIGPKKEMNKTEARIKPQDLGEVGPKEKPREMMTANERKLKTLHPDMSLAEIDKIRKIATSTLEEIPEKKCSKFFY
jgi:hypothetical protein